MEVINFASPKWVYMLKSVEKWLCKTLKYKIVVGGAIFNYSCAIGAIGVANKKLFQWKL
jgi:hypothetical protein